MEHRFNDFRFWIVFGITRISLNRGSLSPKLCSIHFIEIMAGLEKISLIIEVAGGGGGVQLKEIVPYLSA